MAGKDRLTEAHERLTAAVESLVSGEDWQQLLGLAARLYRYSPNNCMLIRLQRPEATWLAGYRRWQALGRQVRKGEKGVAILAPVVTRRREVDTDEEAERPGLVRVLRGFTVAHIFDVSQTDGPPLPEVGPALLDGHAPAELWDRLAAQVAEAGFALTRADCRPANGTTDFVARAVTVRDDVTDAQAAKTLAHDPLTAPVPSPGRRGGPVPLARFQRTGGEAWKAEMWAPWPWRGQGDSIRRRQ